MVGNDKSAQAELDGLKAAKSVIESAENPEKVFSTLKQYRTKNPDLDNAVIGHSYTTRLFNEMIDMADDVTSSVNNKAAPNI